MGSERIESGLVGIGRAANLLGLKVTTLYAWCEQRRVPYVRLGRCLRFDLAALHRWIDERRVEPSS